MNNLIVKEYLGFMVGETLMLKLKSNLMELFTFKDFLLRTGGIEIPC